MDEPSEPDGVCHSCGEKLQPSDNYCPSCGTKTQFADSGAPGRRDERTRSSKRRDEQPRASDRHDEQPGASDRRDEQRETGWTRDQEIDTEWGKSPVRTPSQSAPGAPETRVESESPFRALGVAIGLSAAGILVPLFGLAVLSLLLASVGLLGIPALVGLTILQFTWFAAFGVWYLRRRGYDWDGVKAYFGVEMPSLKDYGLIILTWFAMIIAAVIVGTILMEVVAELLGSPDAEPAQNPVGDIIAENPEIVLAAIAFMFLVVGPAEEILFRGVVQNRLRERFSMVPAIAVASFLFALVHVVALSGQDPVGIAMTISVLFVTSLGLGWIYEYTGNIVVPSLLHGFHNSVIVAITALTAMYDIDPEESVLLVPELLVFLTL